MRVNICKKFVISLISLLMLLPVFTVDASAAGNRAKGWNGSSYSLFFDSADLFSDKEEARLIEAVQDMSEKLELNILIIAGGPEHRMSDYQTEKFCDDTYDDLFGENTDGILLFMDFSGKSPAYDYISTSGRAMLDYDKHLDAIMDSYWDLMPPSTVTDYSKYSDDIAEAVKTFLSSLKYYHGSGDNRIIHDDKTGNYIYFKNGKTVITSSKPLALRLVTLVYGIPIGIIVGLIFFFVTKSHYKFKKSLNPGNYVSRQETNFYRREDRFLRTHTSKVRIQTTTGSGGHSGGGHSGGGHSGGSHGGGGRHR